MEMENERILERYESVWGHIEIVTRRGCYVRSDDGNVLHSLFFPGIRKIGERVLAQVQYFNEYFNTYFSVLDSCAEEAYADAA